MRQLRATAFLPGLVCALLVLLLPRRGNAYTRQRNFDAMHSLLTEDGENSFAANRASLADYMRQVTRPYCTCGPPILQTKFCQQDFGELFCRYTLCCEQRMIFTVL